MKSEKESDVILMALDTERTRKLLQSFDFKTLFVEELGWDHYTAPLVVPVDGQHYTLNASCGKTGHGCLCL